MLKERVGSPNGKTRSDPISSEVAIGPETSASSMDKPPSSWPLAVSGIGYAIMLLIGIPMMTFTWDGSSEADIVAWYGDSGNRLTQLIGAFAVAAGGLAFLWFVNEIRHHITGDSSNRLTSLLTAASGVFTTSLFIGAAALLAVSAEATFSDFEPAGNAELIRVIDSMGFGAILLFGGWAAAMTIFLTVVGGNQTGRLPRWLCVTGLVFAVVLLGSVMFLPFVLLPVWGLVVGIWSLTSGGRTAALRPMQS